MKSYVLLSFVFLILLSVGLSYEGILPEPVLALSGIVVFLSFVFSPFSFLLWCREATRKRFELQTSIYLMFSFIHVAIAITVCVMLWPAMMGI